MDIICSKSTVIPHFVDINFVPASMLLGSRVCPAFSDTLYEECLFYVSIIWFLDLIFDFSVPASVHFPQGEDKLLFLPVICGSANTSPVSQGYKPSWQPAWVAVSIGHKS